MSTVCSLYLRRDLGRVFEHRFN